MCDEELVDSGQYIRVAAPSTDYKFTGTEAGTYKPPERRQWRPGPAMMTHRAEAAVTAGTPLQGRAPIPRSLPSTMFKAWSFLCVLLPIWLAPLARASALTTTIAPNERLCFYADVDKAGEKIGVSSSFTPSTRHILIAC
jgi:hypothetical protein